jgi:hypothetical protein
MPEHRITNCLDQAVLVRGHASRMHHIFPGRSVIVTDEDLKSAEIQNLLAQGVLRHSEVGQRPLPPAPPKKSDDDKPARRKDG